MVPAYFISFQLVRIAKNAPLACEGKRLFFILRSYKSLLWPEQVVDSSELQEDTETLFKGITTCKFDLNGIITTGIEISSALWHHFRKKNHSMVD